MRVKMIHHRREITKETGSNRERGAAIIIALMVSLVLAFLGLGLLMQTSLGLQAAGTDRWVVRALYAADAGTQAEIATLSTGAVAQGAFVLADDTALPGMLTGQYNVVVDDVCELEPGWQPLGTGPGWITRHFHFRSSATRDAGLLVGLTQAAITQDVTIGPIPDSNLQDSIYCY